MGVATGIAVAAVVAAGASAYAAKSQSDASKKAQSTNKKTVKNTNQLNYELFREGRGEEGSAILPLYAQDANGELFEPRFFGDTRGVYDATGAIPPQLQLQRYQEALAGSTLAQQNALGTVNDLYSGQLEKDITQGFQPVTQARLQGVDARKQGTLEALQATLNDIKATQARRGFSGDSLASRSLQFNARRGANTQYADDLARAQEQNALDLSRIQQAFATTKLNNTSLPYTVGRQMVSTLNLPQDALLDQQQRRNQLITGTFGIGTGQFRYDHLPQVQPVASTGQIAAQGIGTLASSLGNYYAQNQLAGQLRDDRLMANAQYPAGTYPGYQGQTYNTAISPQGYPYSVPYG